MSQKRNVKAKLVVIFDNSDDQDLLVPTEERDDDYDIYRSINNTLRNLGLQSLDQINNESEMRDTINKLNMDLNNGNYIETRHGKISGLRVFEIKF